MSGRARGWVLGLAWILGSAGALAAQEEAKFSVRAATAREAWRPLVQVERLLDDRALSAALEAGLPLRIHLRVELWQKELLDRLVEAREISVALVQDPLDGAYLLETRGARQRFTSPELLTVAIGEAFRSDLRPTGRGRFYYLGSLEVESLSLSDLEELRRWLRGEVGPAFRGTNAPERVVRTGMRRLLVRVLGLPTRSLEARSQTFILR